MKAKTKSILPLMCLLAITSSFTGCGETVIGEDQMQERNGLVYTVNQESPFTGVVVKHYESGQKQFERRYKDGVANGKWIEWHDNGKKVEEGSYKNGLEVGKWTVWHENGRKCREGKYKDGLKVGFWVAWYESGHMNEVVAYKDGKKDGTYTRWDGNGQLIREAIYEDGELIEEKIYSPEYLTRNQSCSQRMTCRSQCS